MEFPTEVRGAEALHEIPLTVDHAYWDSARCTPAVLRWQVSEIEAGYEEQSDEEGLGHQFQPSSLPKDKVPLPDSAMSSREVLQQLLCRFASPARLRARSPENGGFETR